MCDKNYTWFVVFLQILRIVAGCIGVALGATYGVLLVRVIIGLIDGNKFVDLWFILFLCLYGLAFSVMIVLAEVRYHRFYELFHSFRNWAIRGLFYFFQGMLSLSIGASTFGFGSIDNDAFQLFQDIIAYALMVIAAIYIIMEIICLRSTAEKDAHKTSRYPNIV